VLTHWLPDQPPVGSPWRAAFLLKQIDMAFQPSHPRTDPTLLCPSYLELSQLRASHSGPLPRQAPRLQQLLPPLDLDLVRCRQGGKV
jgi:hypothetical protein